MDAGREIDALVAEKVMGWHRHDQVEDTDNGFFVRGTRISQWYSPDGDRRAARTISREGVIYDADGMEPSGIHNLQYPGLPPYSTDIAAAWQVAEQIDDRIINSPGDGTDGLPSGLLPLMLVHLGTSGWAARFSDSIDDDRIPVSVASPWWDRTDEIPTAASAKTAPLAICLAALKVLRLVAGQPRKNLREAYK